MKSRSSLNIMLVGVVCILLGSHVNSQAQTPSFMGIGGSAGLNHSYATKVSDDGLFVAGFTTSDWSGGYYGFRWSPFFGFESVGYLPESFFGYSRPGGISGDGSVVVGVSAGFISGASCAFYWTPQPGTVVLDPLLGSSGASGVSADGSVVTGTFQAGWSNNQAFRWTAETGAIGLGYLPGGYRWCFAHDISSDGSVIVGESDSDQGQQAFRWTAETGMVGLGDLPGGGFQSIANGVSADGSVVVGIGWGSSYAKAFLWTQATGMVDLGILPEPPVLYSEAYGVSNDGSVVVGYSSGRAFIWDPVNGMRALQDVLVSEFGLDLTGWTLTLAYDITPDGHTIVGAGYNPDGRTEGWIAVIPDLVRRINAVVDVDPDILTLRSVIPQITCYIRLAAGYSVANIDRNSVLVNGQVLAASVQIDTKKQVATAKFNRSAMSGILVPGVVQLTVTGKLPDRTVFKGVGTITVKN